MFRSILDFARLALVPGSVLAAFSALPASAQNQLWMRQLGTSGQDRARAAAPDSVGGVYVGGYTFGSLGGPNAGAMDAWLARFDSAGSRLWIQQLGTVGWELVTGVAPDGIGGVYVGGITTGSLGGPSAGSDDAWLAHYDSAGNQLWIRQFGTGGVDMAYALAPDGAGGVYACGATGGSLGGQNAGQGDAWVARYDSAGNQMWIRQFGTGQEDQAVAAAPDGSGGLYLGGYTEGSLGGQNAGSRDAWLAHYDSAGNQVWIRQLGTSGVDSAWATAPDGSGGVYMGGSTDGSLGGPGAGAGDAWLARYDSAGNQMWIRQLGTNGTDEAYGVTPDGTGGVYASGLTDGSLGGPNAGAMDAWLAHFDGTGGRLWIRQLGTSEVDNLLATASDGAGGVYVGGETNGDLGGPNAGSSDAWLARYDGSCPPAASYCTASTTSIPGCQSAIAGLGYPTLATPTAFTISSGSVPGGNVGICFFGKNGQATIPFGTLGGQICVQPPVFRSKPKNSGGTKGNCDGLFTFSLKDLIDTSPIVVAGAVINAEIWARDPANPDGFLLSDGLEFTVCP